MLLDPIPNRECGACNVCCKVPVILDPDLRKAPGVLCPNWETGGRCMIYERRPPPCRGYYCAWRRFEQFDDSWRPDISNIYVEVKVEPYEAFHHEMPDAPFVLKFMTLPDLDEAHFELLMAATSSLIANDVPVILTVAAPPGHVGGSKLVNKNLKPFADSPDYVTRFVAIYKELLATPPRLVLPP